MTEDQARKNSEAMSDAAQAAYEVFRASVTDALKKYHTPLMLDNRYHVLEQLPTIFNLEHLRYELGHKEDDATRVVALIPIVRSVDRGFKFLQTCVADLLRGV